MSDSVNLYLAPFQGITGVVYREVYTKHFQGIDKLYTPFFTSIYKQKSLDVKGKELTQIEHQGVPVVPQILSKDADEIIRFARFCCDRGFTEVNWNLGCPYPRVANKRRGSGMLPYPEMADEILEKVMKETEINFSVKCRLGYHSPNEIFKLIPIFNDHKIFELSIHARIGKQLYKGKVDLDHFEIAMKKAKVPIVYNGDIFTIEDFKNMSTRFQNVSSWMIGRGLLIDPFLPGDIKGITLPKNDDRKTKANQFVSDLYLAYRKSKNDSLHSISVMKELWSNMAYSFDHPKKVFNAIKKTKSFDAYEEAIKSVFEKFYWVGANGLNFNSNS